MVSLNSKIGIIGAGKIAYSLVNALKSSGLNVDLIISKKKSSAKSLTLKFKIKNYSDDLHSIQNNNQIIFLTVPDSQIKKAAVSISKLNLDFKNILFVHLSGVEDISVLSDLKKMKSLTGSLHIMQSFPSEKIVDIKKCFAAVESSSISAEKIIMKIAKRIGLNSFRINSKDKVFYHLAGVYASNFIIANLFHAEQFFKLIKTKFQSFDLLEPIITSTLKNAKELGVQEAISGPVERGDLKTIKKHIKALKHNKILMKNYLIQSIGIIELIKKRDKKLSAPHRELEKYLRKQYFST